MLAPWAQKGLLVGCPPQNTGYTAFRKWILNTRNNKILVKGSLSDRVLYLKSTIGIIQFSITN
jgi:hypothetical protein